VAVGEDAPHVVRRIRCGLERAEQVNQYTTRPSIILIVNGHVGDREAAVLAVHWIKRDRCLRAICTSQLRHTRVRDATYDRPTHAHDGDVLRDRDGLVVVARVDLDHTGRACVVAMLILGSINRFLDGFKVMPSYCVSNVRQVGVLEMRGHKERVLGANDLTHLRPLITLARAM